MTTLAEARRKYRETLGKYQEKTPTRTAVLGDGRGTDTANVIVPGRPDYVYARSDVNSSRFFQVLNQGAVQPAANLPVILGYPVPTGQGYDEEQIIRINYAGLGGISSGTVSPIGPHHQQHEFRGGDDILLDSRQFLSGLVHPTNPASMKVQIESFVYFWNTWDRWEISQSKDLTEYLPSAGFIIWVLIALDPEIGTIVYRPGVPYATGSQDVILGTFTPVPAPAGNELPLGFIRLASTTTSINWTTSADNIGDARLWVNPPMLNILDRLRQLEGDSGNPPDLMMTGAATYSVGEISTGSGIVTGGGTANYVARWNSTTNITNSLIQDDGTSILVGTQDSTTRELLRISTSLTLPGGGVNKGNVESLVGTITAGANGDVLTGSYVAPIYTKSTFTSLTVKGLFVGISGNPTGAGTISNYSGVSIEQETFATSNISLVIGGHPGGSTNYAIYVNTTNASVFGGDVIPTGAGAQNLGNASNYWNDVSYKTLTDRGCFGWFDNGVEMPNGTLVSDVEALELIKKHPSLETVYGVPRLDYSTMPKAVYRPADGIGEDGAELTALVSIMLGAIKELNGRLSQLETK